MENENGVDPTPWAVLASQRIVMDIDEAFRKLGEKDYLNKCDYPLPGKRICTMGGGGIDRFVFCCFVHNLLCYILLRFFLFSRHLLLGLDFFYICQR
jgi:hypothetical protein